MKKLSIFSTLVLVAFMLTGCDDDVISGKGTEKDPYTIATPKQLQQLAKEVNNGSDKAGLYYKLTDNINLNGFQSGNEWTPIGGQSRPFCGIFDGCGFVISKLYFDIDGDHAGLFGMVKDGTVKNVGVIDSEVRAKGEVGGIVGHLDGSGKIENCYYLGNVDGNPNDRGLNVGGIVGYVDGSGKVSQCYAAGGRISGASNIGGIAGWINTNGSVSNCIAINSKIELLKNASYNAGRVAVPPNNVNTPNTSSTLSNNAAWSGMKVYSKPAVSGTVTGVHNDRHGKDASTAQIRTAAFFDTYLTDPIWTKENGRLPGFNGNTEKMSDHVPSN